MNRPIVIARAYRGEPLKRIVVGTSGNCVYIANPATIDAVESGKSSPIGFPGEDVFLFNSKAYEALRAEWERRQATDPELWRGLARYRA